MYVNKSCKDFSYFKTFNFLDLQSLQAAEGSVETKFQNKELTESDTAGLTNMFF